jgi:hypothetical protein
VKTGNETQDIRHGDGIGFDVCFCSSYIVITAATAAATAAATTTTIITTTTTNNNNNNNVSKINIYIFTHTCNSIGYETS